MRTLHDDIAYQAALQAVRPYFEHEPHTGSRDAARFDDLVLAIEEYEARQFPIPSVQPIS